MAIRDRPLHHSTTPNVKGERYRLEETRNAGLPGLTSALTSPTGPDQT